MIDRRTVLGGLTGFAASQLLASCRREATETLRITLLEGSVPSEVVKRFQKTLAARTRFSTVSRLAAVFNQLQSWQAKAPANQFSIRRFLPWVEPEALFQPDNLVSLGDYWLTSAIAQQLIDPITLPESTLEQLPRTWREFVTRNRSGLIDTAAASDSENLLWAAPYKVQSLVIVYRKSRFPNSTANNPPFKAWKDLLQPQLRENLALPAHPRVVLGLVQKIQEGRFNPSFVPVDNSSTVPSDGLSKTDLSETGLSESGGLNSIQNEQTLNEQTLNEQTLRDTFTRLNQQVRTYDSDTALKALINEDVEAAVVWSGDVTTALSRYRDLRAVVPAEGSLLSADMWVRPKGAPLSESAKNWIDFCWQTGAAEQISASGRGVSPVLLGESVESEAGSGASPAMANTLLSAEALSKSEPLLPLPEKEQQAYLKLWESLRSRQPS